MKSGLQTPPPGIHMQMLKQMLPKVQARLKQCLQSLTLVPGKGADGGEGLKISRA